MFKWLLLILLFALPAYSQDGVQTYYTNSVILDSTDTDYLYLTFYNRFGQKGFTSSAIDPENSIHLTDDFHVSGYIDSLKASGTKDSLAIGFIPFNADGYVVSDTIWFDYANHDTATVKTYLDWSALPWNRAGKTLGTSSPTFWVDISGQMNGGYYGGKFYLEQVTYTSSADSNEITLGVSVGTKKLSY